MSPSNAMQTLSMANLHVPRFAGETSVSSHSSTVPVQGKLLPPLLRQDSTGVLNHARRTSERPDGPKRASHSVHRPITHMMSVRDTPLVWRVVKKAGPRTCGDARNGCS